MTQTALVVGASGIVGSAITQLLLENDWQVAALSRSPSARPGVTPVAADLQNPESVSAALADLKPTHVFITTWSRQATEAENIRVNAVRPGFIFTDFHALSGDPFRVSKLEGALPMGRGGTAEEVAEAILWLLSDNASYATGTFIDLAGGR
ncbi:Aldo-keto reductase protein [Pseudomonas ficuserectae]|uniref:Aldo-keto reductase protein n=1 Tax=Pseudomonas savastanoi TaxID=29438 RepID=A0A3M5KPR0_PSESS|nr:MULTISPECIES: SDR family oxidoreductase [Pseudomonas syringae group genomosp. 2]RMS20417.1 Aldo-keto reductase protein [Pseudomonas savastanoi]RMS30445.1 Aldo-keto reductase protein [Pseudomonas ficuserectae]RMT36706.1 Aldo-keto reductase protein [Pseudomonas savastanoi]